MTERKSKFVTMDRAEMRSFIAERSPTMFIPIKVGDLREMLDRLDMLEELERKAEQLALDSERIRFEGRRLEALVARGNAGDFEDEPG